MKFYINAQLYTEILLITEKDDNNEIKNQQQREDIINHLKMLLKKLKPISGSGFATAKAVKVNLNKN